MQQTTLEYANVDESTQTLRRQLRQTVAWLTIVYATAQLAAASVPILNFPALTFLRQNDIPFIVGYLLGALSAYPVLLFAGVLLLLDKPKAVLLLRIASGVLVFASVSYALFNGLSFRRANGSNYGMIQLFVSIANACFPVLISLLPLQPRRPHG